MPFSAQCYGFTGGGWRDTWAGTSDNTLRAPVRSEEIGADWGDVFQRLQVVPLQYRVPQVTSYCQCFRLYFKDMAFLIACVHAAIHANDTHVT
jgi:hypothetical protein